MRKLAIPVALPIAMLAVTGGLTIPTPAAAQQVAPTPTTMLQLNIGRGRLINLDASIDNVFVANDQVADVSVRSATQIYVFGKTPGETTVYATTKSGRVAYSSNIRVGNNIDSIDTMLGLAMPDAHVVATTMNGLVLLTGTVASPSDVAEAERLVQAFVGENTKIISRLKTATPLQVNLQVRFAEVSRSFVKNVGVNLASRDSTSGITFGVGSGTRSPGTIGSIDTSSLPMLDASSKFGFPAGTISLPYDPRLGDFVYPNTGTKFNFSKSESAFTSLGLGAKLLGLDLLGAIDLGERTGQVTTLATPNLTALSGESSSFLAGGEVPIPISQGLGAVSIEYKQYGVSLSYTPTVLADGRISLRVRPEVSQLTYQNGVQFGGTIVPGISTRRAETSIELGSGESMMIAGLLSNSHDNSIEKAPGLGDVPILGALFRSNAFQRNETELVIVITPYLVKPVNTNDIVLPTDGYKAPNDIDRILGGQLGGGVSGGDRPKPTMAPPASGPASPTLGALNPTMPNPQDRQQPAKATPDARDSKRKGVASATPGFGF